MPVDKDENADRELDALAEGGNLGDGLLEIGQEVEIEWQAPIPEGPVLLNEERGLVREIQGGRITLQTDLKEAPLQPYLLNSILSIELIDEGQKEQHISEDARRLLLAGKEIHDELHPGQPLRAGDQVYPEYAAVRVGSKWLTPERYHYDYVVERMEEEGWLEKDPDSIDAVGDPIYLVTQKGVEYLESEEATGS